MAIRDLNADNNILILPADKGNATVVMKTDDSRSLVTNLLDPDTYKKLKHDPTNAILRKTNRLVNISTIDAETKQNLRKSESLPPRLYGLPKIHKENVPLRPIVSAIGSPTYNIAKHLTKLLEPYIGQTDTYIRDSTHFIEKIKDITLRPNDMLVSFDVVSLFTMVPINEALLYIRQNFTDDITALFEHCLTTTYFQWNQDFYEQIDGVAMGSPLSPVIANFFMEKFEQQALEATDYKPICWFRYVDDTFVVWSHGEEKLKNFLHFLNSQNPRIQFTMETEKNNQIAFLDVLVEKQPNGKLSHKVYRKPTHTDRYLNKASNHHPGQKRGVIKTLANRATRICEPKYLEEELKHLETALENNGYAPQEIKRALRPRAMNKPKNTEESIPKVRAFLPYIKNVTDRIGKLLERHDVKPIYKPTKTIGQSLRSAKDLRNPLTNPGVYRIPCSCGAVYIGTTKRSINTRLTEHKRNCRHGHTDKSAVAEHTLTQDEHTILFEKTQVLDKTPNYYTRMYREAIEIQKHPENFNRKEEGLKLSKTWFQVLKNTKPLPLQSNIRQQSDPTREANQSQDRVQQSIKAASAPVGASVGVQQHGRLLRPLPHRIL